MVYELVGDATAVSLFGLVLNTGNIYIRQDLKTDNDQNYEVSLVMKTWCGMNILLAVLHQRKWPNKTHRSTVHAIFVSSTSWHHFSHVTQIFTLFMLQFSNVAMFHADISCRDQHSNLVAFMTCVTIIYSKSSALTNTHYPPHANYARQSFHML